MKVVVEWLYEMNGQRQIMRSDEMTAFDALALIELLTQARKGKLASIVDEFNSGWTEKQLKKYVQQVQTEPHDVRICIDGNFNRQDHLAGIGLVVYYKIEGQRKRVRKNVRLTYITSSSEAEFAALYCAIQLLQELHVYGQHVVVVSDAQGVTQTMSGEWALYDEQLNRWADRIEQAAQRIRIQLSYEHVSRKENKEAHQLAKQALQNIDVYSTRDIEK